MKIGLALGVGAMLSIGGWAAAGPSVETSDPLPLPQELPAGPRLREARLGWFDVAGQAETLFADATRELRALFGDADLTFAWHRGTSGSAADVDVNVIVVETSPGVPRRVMGTSHHIEDAPHTVHVFLRHVRQALGLDARPGQALLPRHRAQLGRAVGRVIAHEIVHTYAPSRASESEGEGLRRAQLDPCFLRKEQVRLDPAAVRAVVAALARRLG
jgi:hypothetical protein